MPVDDVDYAPVAENKARLMGAAIADLDTKIEVIRRTDAKDAARKVRPHA